jgi:hypothetical protein
MSPNARDWAFDIFEVVDGATPRDVAAEMMEGFTCEPPEQAARKAKPAASRSLEEFLPMSVSGGWLAGTRIMPTGTGIATKRLRRFRKNPGGRFS